MVEEQGPFDLAYVYAIQCVGPLYATEDIPGMVERADRRADAARLQLSRTIDKLRPTNPEIAAKLQYLRSEIDRVRGSLELHDVIAETRRWRDPPITG